MIEAPKWAKGAVPTSRGWVKGNEVLLARKFTQEEIDEWYAAQAPKKVQPVAPKPEPVVSGTVVETVIVDEVVEEVTPAPYTTLTTPKTTKVKKKNLFKS